MRFVMMNYSNYLDLSPTWSCCILGTPAWDSHPNSFSNGCLMGPIQVPEACLTQPLLCFFFFFLLRSLEHQVPRYINMWAGQGCAQASCLALRPNHFTGWTVLD